jgi:hypothetical protein
VFKLTWRPQGRPSRPKPGAGRLITLATLSALTVLALSATPAQAHYNYVYHGTDLASVSSDHLRVSVCDQEADGHVVWVETRTRGFTARLHDRTTNRRCETMILPTGYPAQQFRLCEQSAGCTPWQRA